MVLGTLRGMRRGRVMTLIRGPDQADERYARPDEAGFWFFAACWIGGGGVILYHAIRLLMLA